MNDSWLVRASRLDLSVGDRIDGHRLAVPGVELRKVSPRDGTVICSFGSGGAERVDQAVAASRKAFTDGRWAKLPLSDRKKVLHRLADLLEKHREELALLECIDVGKPINDALNFDVPHAAGIIRFFAEAADKSYGTVYGVDSSSLSYQLRRPLGVVAAIVGWNFPLVLAATKLGPALAAGNSIVLKPSELTPLSAGRLADLATEAGIPPGVFNVLHGDRGAGAALAAHNDVEMLTFTGSSKTGKDLLIAAGRSNMKRLLLECGGKSPNIVFDDCPSLEAVATKVIARAFWNQGQVCTASSRLLVHESIKEAFLQTLVSKTASIVMGDPLLPTTTFGALVSRQHQTRVLQCIDDAQREGATIAYRGEHVPPCSGGFYVPPMIVDSVSRDSKLAQEEVFGPVLAVMSFSDEEDAIRIANDSIYGLSAILWTRDIGRAHRVTQQIKAGWIVVNATETPVGGLSNGVLSTEAHKQSGFGVEGGLAGLESYMSSTAVQIFG